MGRFSVHCVLGQDHIQEVLCNVCLALFLTDEVVEERVSVAAQSMTTEYITLMAIVAVIGLAVIVLVTVSIVVSR